MMGQAEQLSEEALQEIESRCQSATRGPWTEKHIRRIVKLGYEKADLFRKMQEKHRETGDIDLELATRLGLPPSLARRYAKRVRNTDQILHDLRFMANAREDVQRLLAELRRQRQAKDS
jgi:hypothetical protein